MRTKFQKKDSCALLKRGCRLRSACSLIVNIKFPDTSNNSQFHPLGEFGRNTLTYHRKKESADPFSGPILENSLYFPSYQGIWPAETCSTRDFGLSPERRQSVPKKPGIAPSTSVVSHSRNPRECVSVEGRRFFAQFISTGHFRGSHWPSWAFRRKESPAQGRAWRGVIKALR